MEKTFKGIINLDIRDSVPDWGPYEPQKAPDGAPNVMYIVWDDTGMAAWDFFGGMIDMPNMRRIVDKGLRFTQWHTTALCSPTRSCLMTGRNHHMNGMGSITEGSSGFPGYNGHVPFENGNIAEILVEKGWNTYAVGKWHLCPTEEENMASNRSNWPLGRGFERFYGFLGGETNQWYPELVYDNHNVEQPYSPEEGYHLSKDLVDKGIEFIQDSKVIAPNKPWLMYFCPGANHAPHHCPKEWADKYKGKFDMGYEKYREMVLPKMKEMGIVPENTELTPVNPMPEGSYIPGDVVRPWDSLNDDEKRLFARMAEVYAGFSSYTDHEIGRLLDYLEDSGQLENTIIVVVSDNGASGEGGPDGSVNENKFFNGWPDDLKENMSKIDELGSPETYNHYPTGWAMAFNTPFKMFKRYSYNGGVCDPLIISWPKEMKTVKGQNRDQYHHAIDIVPTILDCCGIEPPDAIKGYTQTPIQGVSMRYTFADPNAQSTRQTQYYAMLGTRSIYHKGWKAVSVHGALLGKGHYMDDQWELYHVDEDRSEKYNVADKYPEKLKELVATWFAVAGKNNVFPLDDRTPVEVILSPRPQIAKPRETYVYYPHTAGVPESVSVSIPNRSYTIEADVVIESSEAAGVLMAQGSRFGGHTFFIKDGKLWYVYNFLGMEEQRFESSETVPTGRVILGAEFSKMRENPKGVANGKIRLYINDQVVAEGNMRTQPGMFGLSGSGLVVGRDNLDGVSSLYKAPFDFAGGTINSMTVNVGGEKYVDLEKEAAAMLSRD